MTFPHRRTAALLSLAAALALAAAPALAAASAPEIVPPPGDAGLWSTINGPLGAALGTVVTGAVAWAATAFHGWTKISITAAQEARVRETLLTGAYKVAHELEIKLDGTITPADRQKVIDGMVSWGLQRMPGPAGLLARLGLGTPVVGAMATKVLGQVIGGGGLDLSALLPDGLGKLASGLLGGATAQRS